MWLEEETSDSNYDDENDSDVEDHVEVQEEQSDTGSEAQEGIWIVYSCSKLLVTTT